MPAMSTNSMVAGTTLTDLFIRPSMSSRGSGTFTIPKLGSMVQKGKLAACAAAEPMRALKRVPVIVSMNFPEQLLIAYFFPHSAGRRFRW